MMSITHVYLRFYVTKKFHTCEVTNVILQEGQFKSEDENDFDSTMFYNVKGEDGLEYKAQTLSIFTHATVVRNEGADTTLGAQFYVIPGQVNL